MSNYGSDKYQQKKQKIDVVKLNTPDNQKNT
jgi:hypothetical protein